MCKQWRFKVEANWPLRLPQPIEFFHALVPVADPGLLTGEGANLFFFGQFFQKKLQENKI